MVPAVVIDIRERAARDPDTTVTPDDAAGLMPLVRRACAGESEG